jgi:hypothetical protein
VPVCFSNPLSHLLCNKKTLSCHLCQFTGFGVIAKLVPRSHEYEVKYELLESM